MSLVTFNNVRYYTNADVYHYTVDNRPLADLASNDTLLQTAIDSNYALILRNQPQFMPAQALGSAVLAPTGSNATVFFNTAVTANTVVTPEANPVIGDMIRIVRGAGATGAFTITFSGVSIAAASTRFTCQFDGTVWQQIA